ncbi:hypothetical protein HBI56_098580 [Parastagonospora nodorum]|uniref:Uncharacterized protein n=1 Tax=Phaeosphaeria nodorum (strain SN15 / ATCC MYA-4574 / FGSC 10173) TaxID=321614 RepID=A0A7U2I257_PHANO|nr:hypothetical protein HBH56_027590 [Parastagonospora nodorum]QRC99043.1 hypothetical protein JI435_304590 [Parastagonospora nodorum SN15]KAH3934446.1 hypothetical protein HBH54_054450 [Parastagonospora nodorum]KAH3949651.1 hypothetical protein HBH53_082140 [Parastagonospora nodorum]KAH3975949.1 hypothetical protein HBH51_083220 [Parastagonospora nodorum]
MRLLLRRICGKLCGSRRDCEWLGLLRATQALWWLESCGELQWGWRHMWFRRGRILSEQGGSIDKNEGGVRNLWPGLMIIMDGQRSRRPGRLDTFRTGTSIG